VAIDDFYSKLAIGERRRRRPDPSI